MKNRRQLRSVLAGLAFVVCCAVVPHQAEAAETPRTYLNGREIDFDVQPFVVSGTTLVPIRGVMTPFGATFEWHQATQTAVIKRGSTTLDLTVGSATAKVNGVAKAMPLAVRSQNGRLMIPIRFVAETFGLQVSWIAASNSIEISDSTRGTVATSDRSEVVRDQADRAVALAKSLIGKPYRFGGTSLTGFDCSGFVMYVASQVGAWVPRTSYEQFGTGTAVAQAYLQPGDLVFYEASGPGASHVGIYIGNGSFVHAENESTGVKVTSLSSPWWSPKYYGARRIFK
ncbi:MAG TPA: NlpC/P60 family protein [Symbiobacteriaceae bacterium]|nr:NlpC/P60 family protein [Symbiobacteriaceae bacterium]